jgi:hypothetical protein
LAAFRIATNLDNVTMDTELGTKLAAIRYNYVDPVTNEKVLINNEMEIPGDEFQRAIDAIRAIPSEQAVVIAYASQNVLENEAVTLRIDVVSDYKVYAQGSTIYSQTYAEPGQASDPYRAIMAAFMEDAKNYLVNDRNIIPSGSGEIIQLTIDDLVALSEQLRHVGFPVVIKMVALKDIYRTDFFTYGNQFNVTMSRGSTQEPE